ncbi:MAG: PAS domain S-box protein [Armatimonadetes bacterium]|nr:PAS domain S-box protein [Armatimonadota bacterium]
MVKADLPKAGVVLAVYAIITAIVGMVLVGLGGADRTQLIWIGLIGLVLIAAVFYPRPVYCSMLLIITAVQMVAKPEIASRPPELLLVIGAPTLIIGILAEAVRRLNEERMRQEAVLWKTEERFRSIFESSGMGIGILDKDGSYTTTNRALQRMLGRRGTELNGTHFYQSMHLDDVAANISAYQELMRGKQDYYQRENRYYRRDGQLLWCRFSVSLVRDARGQPQYAVAMLEDITVSKRAEEALRESEERYRSVVDNIKEVIFQTDTTGVFSFLNPAWTETTGFTLVESHKTNILNYIHSDDRQQHLERLLAVIGGKVRYQRYTVRFPHKTSGFRWMEIFYQLTLDAEGKVVGVSGTLNDITERKREEEERQKLSEQRANMIATVSHELRAPIAAMMLNFDLLADGTLGPLTQEQQEFVQGAIKSILDLAKTVDDLLAVSRLQGGRVKLYLEAVNTSALLEEVYERMLPRARVHDVTLEMNLDGRLPPIETDAQQFAHIVTELIENGIKYSVRGGSVTVSVAPGQGGVIVQVVDNGPGIPDDEKDHIFEPFYRSPAAMRDQIPGTGLGLNIVKQIAGLLDIQIQVTNTHGGGTTFTLIVPQSTQKTRLAPVGRVIA